MPPVSEYSISSLPVIRLNVKVYKVSALPPVYEVLVSKLLDSYLRDSNFNSIMSMW